MSWCSDSEIPICSADKLPFSIYMVLADYDSTTVKLLALQPAATNEGWNKVTTNYELVLYCVFALWEEDCTLDRTRERKIWKKG
uniref:Uncharacterized protein n=1 Tax=Setaria viridis TaxID=4556 RepID=A0A4U6VB60_SETVI|nr:hypothetical protein SEVIR_3G043000v2 [Setaria viridis]TKW24288.1 hypothetical protein SEVIR_3G043000v2 [Setaria viridis]TKW24289.1 hypothetical protein SEVIR_3G043000v2 [Setaria viridis]TKW24290.1 hypothetical protein SEVIR_3G043000v2 [Setaria viridis]TKW24291.1 hypothetical protein SEVIR_3G043000v2 [Setaria viridis]